MLLYKKLLLMTFGTTLVVTFDDGFHHFIQGTSVDDLLKKTLIMLRQTADFWANLQGGTPKLRKKGATHYTVKLTGLDTNFCYLLRDSRAFKASPLYHRNFQEDKLQKRCDKNNKEQRR